MALHQVKLKETALCLLFVLCACTPKSQRLAAEEGAESPDALLEMPVACESVGSLMRQCNSKPTEEKVKKLLAVLSEKLQTASKAEQLEICRDVQKFWQVACGVAQ